MIFFKDPFLIELHFKAVSDQLNNLGYSYLDVQHNFGPFATGIFRFLYGMFDSVVPARLLAAILSFIQVLALTVGINRVDGFKDTNLFVGVIYIFLLHLFPDMIALSPLVLAMTLMCFIYVLVLNIIRGKARQEVFLYVGFLTALSGCFLFPMFLFMIPTLLIIIIYTRFDSRSISLYIFGISLPIILLLSHYQLYDSAERYLTLNLYYGFSARFISQLSFENYVAIAVVPAVFFVFALLKVLGSKTMVNTRQKMMIAAIFYLVCCVVILILLPDKSVYYYLLFLPFLLHFFGVLFMEYNKEIRATFASLFFFVLVLLGSFFDHLPIMSRIVDYKALYGRKVIAEHGKVLNLSDDKNILFNNSYATGLCEYMIAKKYFREESIEAIAFIHKQIISDLPDAIYDPHKIVKQKFDKMADIRKKYAYFEDQDIYKLKK